MLTSQHSSQKHTIAACRMNVHWWEETQISKSSCQLGMLIFKYWPSSITGTASHQWPKQKIQTSSYRVQPQTSALIKQHCPHWMHYSEESASQQLQITYCKLMLTGTLQCTARKENPWQKKSIPAIASFALQPTQEFTSTAKSSSVVPY